MRGSVRPRAPTETCRAQKAPSLGQTEPWRPKRQQAQTTGRKYRTSERKSRQDPSCAGAERGASGRRGAIRRGQEEAQRRGGACRPGRGVEGRVVQERRALNCCGVISALLGPIGKENCIGAGQKSSCGVGRRVPRISGKGVGLHGEGCVTRRSC